MPADTAPTPVTELSLDESWERLRSDPRAVLIDVRTAAEWKFVGVADLSELGRSPRLVEWTRFPDGAANPSFVADATDGLDPDQPILLLCRSGKRSLAAAAALGAAGFTNTFNVTAGFEGDLDGADHRTTGWKHHGLPWRQS